MEHILQFGVNIDDDAIRREVVRLATRAIIEDLKVECRKELGLTGNSYSRSGFVNSMVDGILADCREQVVREAASALAEKAPKQKWYREMMPGAVGRRWGWSDERLKREEDDAMEQKDKKIDRDMPRAPLVYHPDTGETEALPGMGTYVGCPVCEHALVPEWGWCPYCGQRLAW